MYFRSAEPYCSALLAASSDVGDGIYFTRDSDTPRFEKTTIAPIGHSPSKHFCDLARDGFRNGWNHRIAELFVRLSVRHHNRQTVRKPHQPCGFPRGHASRRSSRALRDQNLRTVLEVTRAQGASDSLRIDQPKAKAV